MGTLDLTEALVVHASQGAIEDGDWNVILDIISLKLEMVHSTFKQAWNQAFCRSADLFLYLRPHVLEAWCWPGAWLRVNSVPPSLSPPMAMVLRAFLCHFNIDMSDSARSFGVHVKESSTIPGARQMGHCTKLFTNEVNLILVGQSCAITTTADLGVFPTGLAKLVVFYSSVRQDLIFGTRHAGIRDV
ncbi:hypothetical protein P692DRAFT_201853505 [Suillus brevipes Sb2]|nr:hypothetical protein P692DRAFT_201853505 [Suillus brevipes Sb2]